MKRRLWTSKQKSQILPEGLSEQIDVNVLCQKYQISQAQHYEWHSFWEKGQAALQPFFIKNKTWKFTKTTKT